jgi:hypothetical protein
MAEDAACGATGAELIDMGACCEKYDEWLRLS